MNRKTGAHEERYLTQSPQGPQGGKTEFADRRNLTVFLCVLFVLCGEPKFVAVFVKNSTKDRCCVPRVGRTSSLVVVVVGMEHIDLRCFSAALSSSPFAICCLCPHFLICLNLCRSVSNRFFSVPLVFFASPRCFHDIIQKIWKAFFPF